VGFLLTEALAWVQPVQRTNVNSTPRYDPKI
jgi:hypothetical protein